MQTSEGHAAYMREYRARKGGELAARESAYYAEWRERNKAKVAAQQREYREQNKERLKAKKLAYAEAHRAEKATYDLAYRAARKAAIAAWQRDYHLAHPELKAAQSRNRKALKRAAEGSHTGFEIKLLFKAQSGLCVYCAVSLADGYHADHIIPLVKGGTNWITNIQLLCQTCNLSKHDLLPDEFASRRLAR